MKIFKEYADAAERKPGLTIGQFCAGLPLTELGNAYRLQLRHGEELRYSPKSGYWLAFDGVSWQRNATHTAMSLVEEMVLDLGREKDIIAEWAEAESAPSLDALDARAQAAYAADDVADVAAETAVEGAEVPAEAGAAEPETPAQARKREAAEEKARKAAKKERKAQLKEELDACHKEAAAIHRAAAKKVLEFETHAMSSQSARAMTAALKLAETGLVIEDSEFDKIPELLNTPSATVCLNDGKTYPNRPEDMLTGLTSAGYNPKAARAAWEAFIRDICRDEKGRRDQAKEAYLKVALGYSLFAHNEQALLFIITGDERDETRNGRNGKTVLMDIISAVLGSDYVRRFESRMVCRHNGKAPDATDRLPLIGSRIAFCSEMSPTDLLDTATMKAITGETETAVRALHADARVIRTTSSLWILSNFLPRFSTNEQAVWSRVRRMRFLNYFWNGEGPAPKGHWQKMDTGLTKKLLAEAEGILAWLIEGAVEYATKGFPEYAEAMASLNSTREDNDPVGEFLSSCVVRQEGERLTTKDLYAAYARYAGENGQEPLNPTAFGLAVNGKGYEKSKVGGVVYRTGCRFSVIGQAYASGYDPREVIKFIAKAEDGSVVHGEELSDADIARVPASPDEGATFITTDGTLLKIVKAGETVELEPSNVIPMRRGARG